MRNSIQRTWIGRRAPNFNAPAVHPDGTVMERFTLSKLQGNYVALFFWPLDHTFVCPTEILAFDHRLRDFNDRNCKVVGVSIDSVYSHKHWRDTPVDHGGIGPVGFTMVSDVSGTIADRFGVRSIDGPALRATFLLDRDLVCRHMLVNDLTLGRNIDETLRTLDAIEHVDVFGEVCPANWRDGQAALQPTAEATASWLRRNGSEL